MALIPFVDAEYDLPDAVVQRLRASFFTVVVHGAVAGTPRPTGAAAVYWVGDVTPTNMTDADLFNGPA